jgi:tetratricopeptide (TPR) repeat protein
VGSDAPKKRFAEHFDAFLARSPLSTREITNAARHTGIGYSTLQSWRTGEHMPRVPEDNPNFVAFVYKVAASQSDAQHLVALAKQAWRSIVEAKKTKQPAPFVGRTGQRRILGDHLRHPGNIVVIWGPSGIGKTSLARRLMHEAHQQSQQLTVDLLGSGPQPLSQRQALIHLVEPVAPGVSGGIDALRTIYTNLVGARQTILMLDDAADSEQVLPLLSPVPDCVTVITSRNPLAELESQHGALRVNLGPLQPEESVEFLRSALTGTASELAELATLCRHEPLALRVVVGQLTGPNAPSLAEYLQRHRLAEDPLVERAYQDLSADARHLFQNICLSPGKDITAQAAAAMTETPVPQAEDLLELLVRAQFVQRKEAGRFTVHDALRMFGQERAAAERDEPCREAALQRLAAFYGSVTMAAARKIFPELLTLIDETKASSAAAAEFESERQASVWLVAERHNVVAAGAVAGRDPDLTLSLANALRATHQVRPHGVDWTPIAERALAVAAQSGNLADSAAMCIASGMALWATGKLDVAADRVTEAVDLYKRLRAPRARAFALVVLGAVEHALGHLHLARMHCAESLRIRRRFHELRGQSSSLVFLSEVCIDLGLLDSAAEHATEALALAEQTAYTAGTAGALGNLGRIRAEQGRFGDALTHFHRQLALSDELDFRSRKPIALVGLAMICHRQRHHEQAIDQAVEAASIARDAGNPVAQVDAWNIAGAAHLGRGRFTEAESYHRRAYEAAEVTNYQRGRAEALVGLSLALRPYDVERAITIARDAVDLVQQSEIRLLDGPAHAALAAALETAGLPATDIREQARAAFARTGQAFAKNVHREHA